MSRRFLLCWKLICVPKCAGSKDESEDASEHMALCVVPELKLSVVDPRYMRVKRKRAEKTVRMACISEGAVAFGMPSLVGHHEC